MREMVLNHASLACPARETAVTWLRDVTVGMGLITQHGVAENALRMCRSHTEILCATDWSLFDALQEMRKAGARDEFRFFLRLTSKIPLLVDVSADVKDRFLRCGEKSLPGSDGDPLVLCAITDGISVGFPSASAWDRPQVTVTFCEILDDVEKEASETIDNLTRSMHARPICDMHVSRIKEVLMEHSDGVSLWASRNEAFPYLMFGPEVQNQFAGLNPGLLGTVISKLAILNDSAAKWSAVGGTMPPWGTKVTDESSSVKNDDGLLEARRFRSVDGTRRLFTWHARYGSKGRIHLRFEMDSRKVEIGYIDTHLPLPA